MTVAPEPTGRVRGLFADVSDSERRDGGPELVIWGEHPVIPVPVLPRRKKEMAPSRGRAAASIVTSAAAPSSRSISSRKISDAGLGAALRRGVNAGRRRLQLHFSKNMVDWCLAGVVAAGPVEQASRLYASMAVDGDDLVIPSRSGAERAT